MKLEKSGLKDSVSLSKKKCDDVYIYHTDGDKLFWTANTSIDVIYYSCPEWFVHI